MFYANKNFIQNISVFFANELTEGVNFEWGTFSMWTNTMGKRDSMFSFKVTTQKWIIVPKWVSVKMDFFNGTLKYLYCCVLMVTLIFLPPSLARVRFRFVIISRASSLAIFLTRSSVMYLTPAWPPVDAKRNQNINQTFKMLQLLTRNMLDLLT